MRTVSLALMWHQHQPYYPDNLAGENWMPWVRLHGTKDYLGMVLHLEEVPEFRCTINLVPSLLVQLQAYVDGGTDHHLRVSRRPADGLSHEDALYLLDHFFMANHDGMIRPHPRYQELYLKRGLGADSAEQALPRFKERDLRDLQVWSNLAWMHPLLFEKDSELEEFRARGRGYTEDEKNWLLDRQRALLGEIIPRHRALAERGQIELTTTPFFHPILPLLLDQRHAREAMPDVNLPAYRDGYPEDAEVHVRRAVEQHTLCFGTPPRGMWPSEGSVCQSMLPLLSRHGIEWIATDEEILGRSLNGKVGRDSRGHVRHPELLYRPWRVSESGHELSIVFRDHSMSDQVGFHYQRTAGPVAAADFLGKLHAIDDACRHVPDPLVPVILDGENCWEYYPDGGVSFLRSLYQSAVKDPRVRPLTVGEFLRQHPPVDHLPRLFAGSWISHNFAIWVGHPEDNRAWDSLHQTREFLVKAVRSGHHEPALLARAWDEIYIAEGSDWFWWYGDDHSSALDSLFDDLFRKHLRNVYTLLGGDPPGSLFAPIARDAHHRPIHEQPTSFLNVRVDGRSTYFEWINAAHYVCGNERGTMAMVAKGFLRDVWFGFSVDKILIRVDTEGGPASQRFAEVGRLRVGFVDPADWELIVPEPSRPRPTGHINHGGKPSSDGATLEVATGRILELALPFSRIGVKPGDPVRFYVELLSENASIDRAPREGIFELTIPSSDFERIMWQV
ncbi:MAG: glycoside hydrolase family 57 protein [Isosphaeraceae bacterium]